MTARGSEYNRGYRPGSSHNEYSTGFSFIGTRCRDVAREKTAHRFRAQLGHRMPTPDRRVAVRARPFRSATRGNEAFFSGHFRVFLSLVTRKRGGNRGALAVEFGRSLERVTDPQYPGLVESLAGDLKGERQTVLETDRRRKGRAAGQI